MHLQTTTSINGPDLSGGIIVENRMLVDTHAHLMDTAFSSDLPAVLERAAAAGVVALVCVGSWLRRARKN